MRLIRGQNENKHSTSYFNIMHSGYKDKTPYHSASLFQTETVVPMKKNKYEILSGCFTIGCCKMRYSAHNYLLRVCSWLFPSSRCNWVKLDRGRVVTNQIGKNNLDKAVVSDQVSTSTYLAVDAHKWSINHRTMTVSFMLQEQQNSRKIDCIIQKFIMRPNNSVCHSNGNVCFYHNLEQQVVK